MPNTQNKKRTKSTNTNTEADNLSPALKNKIKSFKEVFPSYKQSTNDDIIAIFEEFNNDFNAAVYGVSTGLVKTDCTESWQTAGQKKKKKNTGARGKSATPKNRNDYGDRRAANSNRGQSASRASSRGGRHSSNSTRNTTQSNDKQAQPPRVASKPTAAAPQSKPKTTAPPRQPTQPQAPKPIAPSQPVTERLSYANVAKSREAWNPNNLGKAATPVSNSQNNTVKEPIIPPPKVEEASVVSSIPSNVQSKPAPSSQPIPPNAGNPFNAPKPAPERQPRVGVLLPGNFTSDDSMSFQFGNLGLLEEETTTTAVPSEGEHSATKSAAPAPQSSSHPKSTSEVKQQSDMSKVNVPVQEGEMPMGMPMSQYPYPMYPVGMEAIDPNGARPMPFYPEQYTAYSRGDGKYPGRGGSTQYSAGATRDSAPSGKFNASNPSTPSEANGNEKNAGSSATQTAAAAQQQTPYPYGPYPMAYGHPFVNQFHGGSYGNQFYPGFYKNPPGFPPGGYQNFGNTGMGYAQEDEYRKMAGQYYPQDGSAALPAGTAPNAPATASGKNSAPTQSSPPKQPQGLEGAAYQSPPGFKNQQQVAAGDYYPDMYGTSFGTPQPFGYPPMGQGYPPQQPQQPQQSSQSSNPQSRNY